jgi:hypothetical protein
MLYNLWVTLTYGNYAALTMYFLVKLFLMLGKYFLLES